MFESSLGLGAASLMSAQKQNENDEGNRWRSIPFCGESLPHQDAARAMVPIPANMFASAPVVEVTACPIFPAALAPRKARGLRRQLFQDVINIGQYVGTPSGILPAPPCNGIRRQPGAEDSALTEGERPWHDIQSFSIFEG